MEQNNIEKQIKEKLITREIIPTEMSWDRLDAMLSVAEEKNKKGFKFLSFRFIGIAASILVFFFIGVFFYSHDRTKIDNINTVVASEKTKDTIETKVLNTVIERNNDNENLNKKNQQLVQISHKPQFKTQNPKSEHQRTQSTTQNPILDEKQQSIAEKNQTETKSEVNNNREKLVKVNPIDLLAAVDRPSKEPNTKKDTKIKVNSNSLLSQVDGEINMTFREKAYKKISKNFKEVKEAIVERNIE